MIVQSYEFLIEVIEKAKPIYGSKSQHPHFVFSQDSLYFKRVLLPDLNVNTMDIRSLMTLNCISNFLNQLSSQMKYSQLINSKYVMRYERVILSYPYACFVHHPIENVLSEMIANNLLSYSQKIDIMLDIAQGLKQLHQNYRLGIRDLKPSSIVLVKQKKGYRVIFSDISHHGIFPQFLKMKCARIKEISHYHSPQIQNNEPHSLLCDVYSIGVIFYEILFGSPERIKEFRQNKSSCILFPKWAPLWITSFMSKMLEVLEEERVYLIDVIKFLEKAKLCCETGSKIFNEKLTGLSIIKE